jgi:DNA-binding transcriptional ArsR family regulator
MDSNNKNNSNISNNEKSPKVLAILKDTNFNYLYSKTEKICTALYMVTNFLATNEPIKWEVRNTSLKFLGAVMSLNKATLSSRNISMRDISSELFQLKSLFNIAYKSGFISEMNYQVIDQELVKLLDFLTEFNASQISVESELFEEDYFNSELPRVQMENEESKIKDRISSAENDFYKNVAYQTNKGHIGQLSYKRQKDIKDTNKRTNKGQMSDTKLGSDRNQENKPKNSARREKIIDILKQKGKVSVKDVSAEIPDVSEKTLQRELVSMVEEGIIQKEGERRWSRYFI